MVKVLLILSSTEWLGESWLRGKALALHHSLAAAYVRDPSNKSIAQLWTHFISLATDKTVIVLPICWHVSLYGEMRSRFTSRCST